MEKLPIKFFVARDEDNQVIEGRGSNEDPKWILDSEGLKLQSAKLFTDMDIFESQLKDKKAKSSIIPIVAVAKINGDATSKSKRTYVSSLLNDKDNDNVIGFDGDSRIIFKISSENTFGSIRRKIKNFTESRFALSCIDEIKPFKFNVSLSDEIDEYKIKLIDFQNYELNNNVQRLFELTLKKLSINFTKTYYSPNLPVYKLIKATKVQLDALELEDSYSSLFSITPMPKYSPMLDSAESIGESFLGTKPEENTKYEIIGILDNGISKVPQLVPWLHGSRWSPYPQSSISETHGTFVAGVAVYGDALEKQDWVGHYGVKVFDAAVFPDLTKESLDEDELISNIQRAVELYHNEIKIWSLSISMKGEVQEDKFSDFAIALDALQDKYNIIICKSAGNTFAPFYCKPKERLNLGADSVRSLVIGSVAHKKNDYDLVDIGNPSPFSRVGPGPQFIIKPEVSHYGGNAGIDESGNIITNGVKSFNKNGEISTSVGTSFSTPRIASLIAGLSEELDEEFDPLLLKALVIHNAQYPNGLKVPDIERTKQLGFGVPNSIKQIIYNKNNEATLILRDSLAKGEMINILDFPMPQCLIKNGYYTGKITVTLIYEPILDATQGAEYCQSNIDVFFGSYDQKTLRDTTKKSILNPIGRAGAKNILNQSLYSKTIRKSNTDEFALRERLLIQYSDKYYPVKKYAIDLLEMSASNKLHYLGSDKKWYFTLRGLYRDFIENQSKQTGEVLSQEFCAIITIKGEDGMPVYDNVTQQLDNFHFIHNNIQIANDIKVKRNIT
jgi:hypothetical protein